MNILFTIHSLRHGIKIGSHKRIQRLWREEINAYKMTWFIFSICYAMTINAFLIEMFHIFCSSFSAYTCTERTQIDSHGFFHIIGLLIAFVNIYFLLISLFLYPTPFNVADGDPLLRYRFYDECKRRYTIKLWKTFTDCFNCLPVAAIGMYTTHT